MNFQPILYGLEDVSAFIHTARRIKGIFGLKFSVHLRQRGHQRATWTIEEREVLQKEAKNPYFTCSSHGQIAKKISLDEASLV